MTIYRTLGWLGATLAIGSYLLLSNGYVGGEKKLYNFSQLVVGLFIGAEAYHNQNISLVILEVFWCLIALRAIVKKKRNNSDAK